jgi:formamidopyrimidine-DNA glycosylase
MQRMPELPEVETIVRDLAAAAICGHPIATVTVRWPPIVATHTPRAFSRALVGCAVAAVRRRGKYIILELDGGRCLVIHLRMTGQFRIDPADTPLGKHDHVVLGLDDGRAMVYTDTRKFGRWRLVDDAAEVVGHLGPEPLSADFTAARFAGMIANRRGVLKPLLLNQAFLAGLGNIYVDEALWEASLHPQRRAETLTAAETRLLWRTIRRVLRLGVQRMGTSLGTGKANFYSVAGRRGRNQDRLKVFRRTGQPCPRCATPIERLVVAQRGTHICPQCQPEPGGGGTTDGHG